MMDEWAEETTDDLTEEEQAEIEKNWQEFWKDILVENGELQIEQLKCELFDFSTLIDNISIAYDLLTHGMVSKPLTDPHVVVSFVEEREMKAVEEAELEEGQLAAEMTAYMIENGWSYSDGQFTRNGVNVSYKLARRHFAANSEPPPF